MPIQPKISKSGWPVVATAARPEAPLGIDAGGVDPFPWAAFVLIGDGDIRVPLASVVRLEQLLMATGAIVLLLVTLPSWWLRRGDRP